MRAAFRVAIFSIVVLASAAFATADANGGRDRLVGAGVGDHLWWADRRVDDTFLLHASLASATPCYLEAARFARSPEAMAAHGDAVWLIFPAQNASGGRTARDVTTVTARRNVATGLYYPDPPNGADVKPSLSGDDDLVALAADANGPWALLVPRPSERFGVHREGASEAHHAAPRLMRLGADGWAEIALPEGAGAGARLALVRLPRGIGILADEAADEADGPRLLRRENDAWIAETLPPRTMEARWLVADGRTALVNLVGNDLEFAYVRNGRLLDWGRSSVPGQPWLVAGDRHGATILFGTAGSYERRHLPPLDPAPGPAVTLVKPGFSSGSWIHLPILGILVASALMAWMASRSLSAAALRAEEKPAWRPMSLDRRFVAFAIDALPPSIVALYLFHARPTELLALPAWSLDPSAVAVSATAIALLVLHCTIGEAVTGRSLGKWLVGGAVVSADGSPPSFAQILLRNFLKAVTVAAPILGVFALVADGGRGVADVIARTVVIDGRSQSPSDE